MARFPSTLQQLGLATCLALLVVVSLTLGASAVAPAEEQGIAPGKFITMAYLAVDPARGEVASASAGHPAPRLLLADGTVRALDATGLVLGIEAGQGYEEVRADLPPRATIVLYTDGVVEARRRGEMYGVERLDVVYIGFDAHIPESEGFARISELFGEIGGLADYGLAHGFRAFEIGEALEHLEPLLGATGFITHLANIWPEHEVALWKQMDAGDYAGAQAELQRSNWRWVDFRIKMAGVTGGEANVVKAAYEIIGRRGGPVRPPTRDMSPEHRAELKALLREIGVPNVQD